MAIKTLHITNSYHPASGGIRTFYRALLHAANRQRRFMRLVVPGEKTFQEEVGEFGRIYHIATPRSPLIDSRYRWMLPHLYAWPYQSPLRQILSAERPDLVEVCDKFWLIYLTGVLRRCWIPGVPVPTLVGLACERLDENMAIYVSVAAAARRLTQFYMRHCWAPRFDFHIAASEYIAEEVRQVLPARLNDRLHVCPMGVDFETFSEIQRDAPAYRQKLLRRVGGSEKTVLLLYAGRLSKEKNLEILAPMLAQLKHQKIFDYRLVISGEGPQAGELRELLEGAARGQALFLGHCHPEELVVLHQACDVFIHPNPREPFGIAPLEAMAAGLPVVAPCSGGLLTYANPENAWLAENTPEGFAEAVTSVYADRELCRRKIAAARVTAERFSWPHVTDNYFQLYDSFHERFLQPDFYGKKGIAQGRRRPDLLSEKPDELRPVS